MTASPGRLVDEFVIPARYASTRFPGKPLADATGKPLIRHVVERVRLARQVGRIIVATDDQRILYVVREFGCEGCVLRPVVEAPTHQDHGRSASPARVGDRRPVL